MLPRRPSIRPHPHQRKRIFSRHPLMKPDSPVLPSKTAPPKQLPPQGEAVARSVTDEGFPANAQEPHSRRIRLLPPKSDSPRLHFPGFLFSFRHTFYFSCTLLKYFCIIYGIYSTPLKYLRAFNMNPSSFPSLLAPLPTSHSPPPILLPAILHVPPPRPSVPPPFSYTLNPSATPPPHTYSIIPIERLENGKGRGRLHPPSIDADRHTRSKDNVDRTGNDREDSRRISFSRHPYEQKCRVCGKTFRVDEERD